MNPHRGIRIDAILVKDAGGLIFTVGALAIFLVGVPVTRWFLLGAVILGLVNFGLVRLMRR